MKKLILILIFTLLFLVLIKISIAVPPPPPVPPPPDDDIGGGSDEITENCSDNIKNQDETDIDCGGTCDKCDNGKSCSTNSDCESDYCNPDEERRPWNDQTIIPKSINSTKNDPRVAKPWDWNYPPHK